MIEIMFSYAHEDQEMRDQLEVHLSSLKRQGVIGTWHDRRIGAGVEIDGEIDKHLTTADIILLLVSPYFIASDYCHDVEMQTAMARHKRGEARVIPVILDYCDWLDLPFGKLLAVPTDGRPIAKYPNRNEAFLEVVKAIKGAVADVMGQRKEKNAPSQPLREPPVEIVRESATDRSSNLRIKRQFTDLEKDSFFEEAYEYMAKYFENSLNELKVRNPKTNVQFSRNDRTHFLATIYDPSGSAVSRCTIRLGGLGFGSSGIAYTSGHNLSDNTLNELLTVDDDGYAMFLRATLGLRSGDTEALSFEGAAELFWHRLMEPLQR